MNIEHNALWQGFSNNSSQEGNHGAHPATALPHRTNKKSVSPRLLSAFSRFLLPQVKAYCVHEPISV
jgi:hypothetical protein